MVIFSRVLRIVRSLLTFLHLSARAAMRLLLLVLVLCGLLVVVLNFWFIPHLNDYRDNVAQAVERELGRPTQIERVSGEWQGTHILIKVSGFQIADHKGAPLIRVERAEGELSWWTLVKWDVVFRHLNLDGALLRVGRDARGQFWLGDLPLKSGGNQYTLPNWLLRQQQWSLKSGILWWQDARNPGGLLKLQDINAHFEHGFLGHELSASAQPEWGGHMPWTFSAKWSGRTLEKWERWRGQAEFKQPSTQIQQLWPWLGLPPTLAQGEVATRWQLTFDRGDIVSSGLNFSAKNLQLAMGQSLPPLSFKEASGVLRLQPWKQGGYELQATDLALRVPEQNTLPTTYTLKSLRLGYRPAAGTQVAEGELELPQFDLSLLPRMAPYLPASAEQRLQIAQLNSSGLARQFLYHWRGSLETPTQYQLGLQLQNAAWQASTPWPTVKGLNASLSLNERQGSLQINSPHLDVLVPKVLDRVLTDVDLKTQLTWQRQGDQLKFTLGQFNFSNRDVKAQFKGDYLTQATGSGVINLVGDLGAVQAKSVSGYLPKQLDPITHEWLAQAFLAGTVPHTHFELRGALQDFPFAGNSKGVFRIESELQDIQLLYGPGWPTVDQIRGRLLFEGRRMEINAKSAKILGTQVKTATVLIPELDHLDPQLTVQGEVEGATRDFLSFLPQSPLNETLGGVARALNVDGNGALTLGLTIPLQHVIDTQVRGRYKFTENTINALDSIPRVEHVSGDLAFTETGASMQQGRGVGLGGAALLNIRTLPKNGGTELEINGHADVRQVAAFYQLPFAERFSGSSDYRVVLVARDDSLSGQVQSNLEGAALNLPAPLGKTAAEGRSFRLEIKPLKAQKEQWIVNYQKSLGANVIYSLTPQGGILERGQINLGSHLTPAAERAGLWLTGHLPLFRLSEWQPLFQNSDRGFVIDGVNMNVDALEWQGRRWPTLSVDVHREQRHWVGRVNSPLGQGELVADFAGAGRIEANLKTLTWPELSREAIPSSVVVTPLSEQKAWNPAAWPNLTLKVEHVYKAGRDLGRLQARGAPVAEGYQLSELQLENADGTLSAKTSWLRQGDAWAGQLQLGLVSQDMGQWLSRWGKGDLVKRGKGTFSADLNWVDKDLVPAIAGMNGSCRLDGEKGVLLKINPGIGRILGLLNLETLLRRARLDFRDVFNEGLAFDKIAASAKISTGSMVVERFDLVSPAVGLSMDGQANLVTEAINLRVRVVPAVSTSVAVAAGTIVNPVVGLSIYLLQKLLSNPVGKMLTYTYFITGRWSQPEVQTVAQPPASTAYE